MIFLNFFSYKKPLRRLPYFFLNSILMFFAFRYLYYSYLYDLIVMLEHNPKFTDAFYIIKSLPQYHESMATFKREASPTLMTTLIHFLFLIPLRIIDIKRIKDIFGRCLSTQEIIFISITFSLPFVDFLSTTALMLLPSKKIK